MEGIRNFSGAQQRRGNASPGERRFYRSAPHLVEPISRIPRKNLDQSLKKGMARSYTPAVDSQANKTVDLALWVAAIGSAASAAYFMLVPTPAGAAALHPTAAHFLLYFLQAFVTLLAAVWRPGDRRGSPYRRAIVVTAGVVAYATTLEVLQWAIPERQTELADVMTNVLGATAGLAAWHLLRRIGSGA